MADWREELHEQASGDRVVRWMDGDRATVDREVDGGRMRR